MIGFLTLIVFWVAFTDGSPRDNAVVDNHIEYDPKEEFFKYLDRDEDFRSNRDFEEGDEIPKPGGFPVYNNERLFEPSKYHVMPSPGLQSHFKINLNRKKRSDDDDDIKRNLKIAEEIKANIEKRLGKHLEFVILEPENATVKRNDSAEENTTEIPTTITPDGDILSINDFIRFRRSADDDDGGGDDLGESRQKRREEEKMLETGNVIQEGLREPRGVTKEQWIKQPYLVRNNFDETPSPADDLRAPRVHFVTQRRSESIPPIVYRSYERESRMRDLDRDYYTRPFYPTHPRYQYRRDPFYYDETRDRRYDSRFDDKYNGQNRDRYSFSNKQRRIIYYATLPDVVRTPPNVDLRDRYSFRDRYDDRYVTSPTVSVGDPYRFRKQTYSLNKSRYEQEVDRNKTPLYPLKVSTDVNVREIKKNPERRIYSEPDRRYKDENYNRHQ